MGHRLKDANAVLLRAFSNTRFASRNSTAIDIIRLVTGPVTVNGNKAREKTSVQDPVTLVASRQSLRVAQRLRAPPTTLGPIDQSDLLSWPRRVRHDRRCPGGG